MTRADDDPLWEKGWEGHEIEQLRRLARLPFVEKLRWLEDAARLVEHLSASARSRRALNLGSRIPNP